MRLIKQSCSVAFCLGLLSLAQIVSAQSINFTLGLRGISSLTYGSSLVVTSASNGTFLPTTTGFKPATGNSYTANAGTSYTVDLVNNIVTNTNAKFIIQCHYVKVSDTRFDFRFVVKNTSTDTLTYSNGQFAIISSDAKIQTLSTSCAHIACRTSDAPEDVPSWGTGGWDNNSDGGPQISFFSLGSFCNVAVCNMSDPAQSHSWSAKPSGTNAIFLYFSLSQHIAPNKYSDTCTISLRFDPSGTMTYPKLSSLCSDAAMRYAGAFPSHLDWLDRRPIGECMLSSSDAPTPTPTTNPGRWGQPYPITTINTTTTQGLEDFRTYILGQINACITNTKSMNGQGIITWDIESQRYLNDGTSYPGDPDMATTIAPEWNFVGTHSDSIIDDYFKAQRDAGLIPGLCIRPQKFVITNGRSTQQDKINNNIDPGQEIFEDVDYAYKRWGVRIFYIDSNVDEKGLYSAHDLMQKALAAHPDILMLGEWETYNYFQWSGVYDEVTSSVVLPNKLSYTPSGVRMVYPNAVSMIYFGAFGGTFLPVSSFISGARKGDIYLTNVWYQSAEIDSIKKINTILGNRPRAAIISPSNGAVVGTTLTISATASDSLGTVDSVEFLSAGIKIGVSKNAPYSFTWTNALPGKHTLYARAVDNSKTTACSQPVNVLIDATAIHSIDGPMLKNNPKGPVSVSVYSLNGRLIRQTNDKDSRRLKSPIVLQGLSSGIYILKIRHANGAIDKRKIEAVW